MDLTWLKNIKGAIISMTQNMQQYYLTVVLAELGYRKRSASIHPPVFFNINRRLFKYRIILKQSNLFDIKVKIFGGDCLSTPLLPPLTTSFHIKFRNTWNCGFRKRAKTCRLKNIYMFCIWIKLVLEACKTQLRLCRFQNLAFKRQNN